MLPRESKPRKKIHRKNKRENKINQQDLGEKEVQGKQLSKSRRERNKPL
jgi:hypothetical protein